MLYFSLRTSIKHYNQHQNNIYFLNTFFLWLIHLFVKTDHCKLLTKSTCSASETSFLFNWHHHPSYFYTPPLQPPVRIPYYHITPSIAYVCENEQCTTLNIVHLITPAISNVTDELQVISAVILNFLGIILLTECQKLHQIGLKMQNYKKDCIQQTFLYKLTYSAFNISTVHAFSGYPWPWHC